jgi:hypothetical protein
MAVCRQKGGAFYAHLGHFPEKVVSFSPSWGAYGIARHLDNSDPRKERIRKTPGNTPLAWKAKGSFSAPRGPRMRDDQKRLQAPESSTQKACYWEWQAKGIRGCLRDPNRKTSQERMWLQCLMNGNMQRLAFLNCEKTAEAYV